MTDNEIKEVLFAKAKLFNGFAVNDEQNLVMYSAMATGVESVIADCGWLDEYMEFCGK